MKRSRKVFLFDDILEFSVLPRLPAKSLVRFKCVSKRWYDLVSNNQFFILQQYQNCTAPRSLIYQECRMSAYILGDRSSVGFPGLPLHFEGYEINIISSCNGLILAMLWKHWVKYELHVGNPVLRDWKKIPTHKMSAFYTELAFDPTNSVAHYELVCPHMIEDDGFHHIPNNPMEYGFEVFSSKTGKWEASKSKIVLHYPISLKRNSTFLNGTLYWKTRVHVLWFDTKRDCCGLIPLSMETTGSADGRLNESNGNITYTRIIAHVIEVWSMKDFQWSKMYHIRIEDIVQGNPDIFDSFCHRMNLRKRKRFDIIARSYEPLPMVFEGKEVFFMINRMAFGYDVETGEATQYPVFHARSPYWFPYMGNLIPLPGQS